MRLVPADIKMEGEEGGVRGGPAAAHGATDSILPRLGHGSSCSTDGLCPGCSCRALSGAPPGLVPISISAQG